MGGKSALDRLREAQDAVKAEEDSMVDELLAAKEAYRASGSDKDKARLRDAKVRVNELRAARRPATMQVSVQNDNGGTE